MKRVDTTRLVQTAVALGVAGGLKTFYSTSSVNDLKGILAPTTFLVELVTGERFYFESYAGYMNTDRSFLIADSCSGMNFLIAAFLMIAMILIWRSDLPAWATIPLSFIFAYAVTIAANTVRIAVAIKQQRMEEPMIWVNPEQLHRLQGIFIYFGFLLLIFLLLDRTRSYDTRRNPLRYLIPLSIYWVITLGVPILNGAFNSGIDIREHLVFVVVTPLLILTPLFVVELVRRMRTNMVL